MRYFNKLKYTKKAIYYQSKKKLKPYSWFPAEIFIALYRVTIGHSMLIFRENTNCYR